MRLYWFVLAASLLAWAAGQDEGFAPVPRPVVNGLLTDEHINSALGVGMLDELDMLQQQKRRNFIGMDSADIMTEKRARTDIDPEGPCKEDLKHHCSELLQSQNAKGKGRAMLGVHPMAQRFSSATNQSALSMLLKEWNMTGAAADKGGQLAKCIKTVMQKQRMAITSAAAPVSAECRQDTRDFFASRAQDIRNDYLLLLSCAPEIRRFCPKVLPGDGRVVSCLKTNKLGLSQRCGNLLSRRQIESAEDISLDAKLAKACGNDQKKYCATVGWGAGAAKSCLEGIAKRNDKTKQLEPQCKSALYRRALEDSEDIRFDFRVSQACQPDRNRFCSEVQPGKGRVIDCLERHMKDSEFTVQCKKLLERRVERKSRDIRLDFRFRLLCRDDVRTLCPSFETLVTKPWIKTSLRGADLIECMRDNMPQITNPKCQQHMYNLQKRGAEDPTLDSPLQRNCVAEIKELCSDIPPSNRYRIVTCLNKKKQEGYIISQMCTNVLMKRVSSAAKDFHLNPVVKTACSKEYLRFCKDSEKFGGQGGHDIMDCLDHHKQDIGFMPKCKDTLEQFQMELMSDWRLVKDLHDGYSDDVKALCSTVEPGEGRIINCLQEKRSLVSGSHCRAALLRITGMATDDWRMDFNIQKSCRQDVQQFCAGVEPGEGRVHQCLRANEERISPSCRQMERSLEAMEHEDVRLNPRLKACIPAVRKYCKDVAPGGANRIACLQDHMPELDFPPECFNAMEEVIEKSSTRFYLNPRVKTMCNDDVNRFCRWSDMGSDPDSSILSCLAKKVQETQPECRRELVRVVRLQLWRYKAGMPLTSPCDGDATRFCEIGTVAGPFLQAGYVSNCLMQKSAEISRGCWALISLPDSEGVRAAAKLEAKYWHMEFAEQHAKEWLRTVADDVEGKLHQRLHGSLQQQVERNVEEHVERVFKKTGPAWMIPILIISGGLIVLGGVAWYSYFKAGNLRSGVMVVKDGRA